MDSPVCSFPGPHPQVDDFFDFPQLDDQTDAHAEADHCVGLVVQHVQDYDQRLEHVEEHRPDRQPFQRFAALPELDV